MKSFLVLFLLFSSVCFGQDKPNTIVVTGTAKAKIKPDIAVLKLSVQKNDTSETMVMEKLNQEVHFLAQVLEKQGFDKKQIKISDYKIEFSFNSENNKNQYAATNVLSIEFYINESLINQLLVQIESKKLEGVDISFEYKLSDSLENATHLILVQQAIADARRNAENISRTLKIPLKKISSVSKPAYIPIRGGTWKDTFAYEHDMSANVRYDSSFGKYEIEDIELSEDINIVYEI